MSYMRGQQEYFALPNRHIVKITVVADLHHHVALQLVKEFLDRVVMIIGAFVWTADHHHGHFAVLEHLLVADRRLKQVCVLVDPLLKVERFKPTALHDGVLPRFSPQTNSPQATSLASRRSGYINHAVRRKGHVRYWHKADITHCRHLLSVIGTQAAFNPPPPHTSPLLAHPKKTKANIAATTTEKITTKISVSRKLGLVIAANAARLFPAE